MHRRTFLARASQSVLATTLLTLAGCASKPRRPSVAKKAAPSLDSLTAELLAQLRALSREYKVPGVSVALVQDAKIAWRAGFGLRDTATQEPVDHNTVFQAASMSKPVFAYAALKLCEKGVLGLDSPLTKYAAEPFFTSDPRLELITPRHILSHTSGLPNWRSGREPLKTHFSPGSQYQYSGEGYFYLQSVITDVTNGRTDATDCGTFEGDVKVCATDIDEFLVKNVLAPFEMKFSGYMPNANLRQHLALGHDESGNPLPQPKPNRAAMTRYASAGALLTTPTDYAKFLIEILEPKKPDAFRLKPGTISEMLRPHTKVVQSPFTSSWALGWQIQDNGLFNHGGDNKGFHCHAIASRESKSALVVMTNGELGYKLIEKLFASGILTRIFPANT